MPAEDKTTKADGEDAEKKSPDNVNVVLAGRVEKIIPAVNGDKEKAQISVQGADDLYREIRIENTMQDTSGPPVALKEGAEVDVTIERTPKTQDLKSEVFLSGLSLRLRFSHEFVSFVDERGNRHALQKN